MAWQPGDRGPLEPVPALEGEHLAGPQSRMVTRRGRRLPPRPGEWVRQLGRLGKLFSRTPHFRGLGGAQVKWAWSASWMGAYQPLAWLFLEAQYAIWKLDPAPVTT